MILTFDQLDYFKFFIRRHTGNIIADNKNYLIEKMVDKVVKTHNIPTVDILIEQLKSKTKPDVVDTLVDEITIHETSWFRDKTPWDYIKKTMPDWIRKIRSKGNRIKIWSGAASTGQEIYSTIITILEYLEEKQITDVTLDNFLFLASDISKGSIEQAKIGVYDKFSMSRGMTDSLLEKYFVPFENGYKIDEKIVNKVNFQIHNLLTDEINLTGFDLIMLRNVLIYFDDESKEKLLKKISPDLDGSGVLMFGAFEIVQVASKAALKKVSMATGTYFVKI